MKTPVEWIPILGLTLRTHGKLCHGSLGPVIGHILNDGKTRSAIGAVYEGIAIAPVTRIKDFPAAVAAYGDIRGYHNLTGFLLDTLQNYEIRKILYRKLFFLAAPDYRQRRRLFQQGADKLIYS
jgi:hypothetical protein